MTQTTWDPSNTGGWALSHGNLTAVSPDNNTPQSIFVAYANAPIPDHARTYFEYTVSGAAIQTAFTVGFGVPGFDPGNKNLTAEGATIRDATFVGFSYNVTVTNSVNVIYDPQGNATFGRTHPGSAGSPNRWPNGSVIGVLVDRIDTTVQFTLNGSPQGGPFDISGLGGKTVLPFVDSWFRSGPVATINGGSHAFAERLPSGYTALDASSGGGGGSNGGAGGNGGGDTDGGSASGIFVNQPPNLTVGTDVIVGNETDPTQPVYLSWRSNGTPSVGDNDVVQATVNSNGNFRAAVNVDHAGTPGTMFVGNAGALTAVWSGTPAGISADNSTVPTSTISEQSQGPENLSFVGGSGSTATGYTVTVGQPADLTAGVQNFFGTESDSTQPVFLNWRNFGTPALGDSGWTQATVHGSGRFFDSVEVDRPGVQGTMFYRVGSGPPVAAWTATPS